MQRLSNGVGLGTFPFANPFSYVSDVGTTRIVHHYLESGGEYFDTSPTYAFGVVEESLGRALRGRRRQSFFISSSCGYVRDGNSYRISGRRADVIACCTESLQRLGVDYVDIYSSHIPDPTTSPRETAGALKELQDAGKARACAVSNVTLDQLRCYNGSGAISYVQNRFSLLNRSLDPGFVEYCREHDIGIIAYQVIERGLLTSVHPRSGMRKYRKTDLRRRKPEFARGKQARLRGWVQRAIQPIAAENGISVATLAVAWALNQPGVVLCQMGATSSAQVDDHLRAASFALSDDVAQAIELAYAALETEIRQDEDTSVRGFMGLENYDIYSGSASGR